MTRTIINILIATTAVVAVNADDTDLIEAARTNDGNRVAALLEDGTATATSDDNGHTALHYAARRRETGCAQWVTRRYLTEDKQYIVFAVGGVGADAELIALSLP